MFKNKNFIKSLVKFLIDLFTEDMLVKVNTSQPLEINGKVNQLYFYEISANTAVTIRDDLKAIESQVIYDIYWQNTNDTSTLTLYHEGTEIVLEGDTADPTMQNHTTIVRHPLSSRTGDITSIIEIINSAVLNKR